jgi:hypothetical protein
MRIELNPNLCLTPTTVFDQVGELIDRMLGSVMYQEF